MAVRIRLSRIGKTNRPYWRVVVVDSRKKRDGEFIEKLGTYDPIKHEIIQLDQEGIDRWTKVGAIPSDAVLKIVRMAKRQPAN